MNIKRSVNHCQHQLGVKVFQLFGGEPVDPHKFVVRSVVTQVGLEFLY